MDARTRDRTILRLAVPALATLAIEPLYVLVDTAIVGHLGTTPLGGVALAATALNTVFFVVTVLEYGITARVAFHLGGRRPTQAAGVMVQGLWPLVPALFSGDGAVRDRATAGLLLVAVLQIPASFVFVLDGVLLGAGDDAYQGWSNAVAFAAAAPVAAVVLHRPALGIAGVWIGMNVWMIARLVANGARFMTDAWTQKHESPITPEPI